MGLKIRFGGIALLIFLALFFDPMDGVFKWDVISGVCEEVYNYEGNASDDSFTPIDDVQGAFSCGDGSISITVPKIAILLDIPTFLFIWLDSPKYPNNNIIILAPNNFKNTYF